MGRIKQLVEDVKSYVASGVTSVWWLRRRYGLSYTQVRYLLLQYRFPRAVIANVGFVTSSLVPNREDPLVSAIYVVLRELHRESLYSRWPLRVTKRRVASLIEAYGYRNVETMACRVIYNILSRYGTRKDRVIIVRDMPDADSVFAEIFETNRRVAKLIKKLKMGREKPIFINKRVLIQLAEKYGVAPETLLRILSALA